MDTEIMVEAFPILGVCTLCLGDGAVKSMFVERNNVGTPEVYSEMLQKCFSIDVSSKDLGDSKKLICDQCISKLRDSIEFKQLVEESICTLEKCVQKQKEDKLKVVVKQECSFDMDVDDFVDNIFDHDRDSFEESETKVQVKIEPVEGRKLRKSRKLSKGLLKVPSKTEDLSETETLLQAGLFPFKIKKFNVFSCAVCPEKSRNLDDLKAHVMDHKKLNVHLAFRKMLFSNSYHFFRVHAKLRCKICTTDLSNFEELKDHLDACTGLKSMKSWNHLPFKLEKDQLDCPVCKKTFLNYVNLNTHMNVHYPNYICENCGKAFASKARLRGHMRTHEVGSFQCRYCSAVFDRVTKRENHVSKEHKSGVRYACKRCNISLTSFYARQKHLAEVHNEELKRYKCKACPQSYITPGHLSSHVRRDHLNERNHKCDKCDLAFYTKNALKMHMIKHDGERIHICPVCQKSYQRKKTLREHMRIHNNDKRFVCPVCTRAFTQKCTLKGHMKVHERKIGVVDRLMEPLHSI